MSSRPIEVVLLSDIVENNVVVVAAGTEGTVTSTVMPTALRQYVVRFSSQGNPERTVSASQIRFRDGTLGPVRAIIATTGGLFLNDIDFESLYSNTDLVVDNSLSYFGGALKMTFADGTTMKITADANNDIDIETKFQ
jgi:hypothetical protein